MYKVLGSDQKEYGPVTADFIRQWIAERRLNAQSLIQAEGAIGWQPLSFYQEFASDLARQAPLPASAFPPVSNLPPQTQNGMALASLILGCVSIVCCQPLSILGIIFGIIALSQIKQNPHQSGRGLAIAGLAVSAAGVVLFALLMVFGFFSEMIKSFQR